jgi:GNAT superfamily N-acetyltransferase
MQIHYSTLPESEPELRTLIDRIGLARSSPTLPFSPFPGDADAGWLAGSGGEACGYGWIRRQTGKRALVEISAFPAELATVFGPLLEACREQAQRWECVRVVAYIPDSNEALTQMFRVAGFNPTGTVSELRIDLRGDLPEPIAPEGYFLKPYNQLQHLPTLAALLHRAYHDKFSRPEYEDDGVTVDTVRAELEADPGAEIESEYFTLLNVYGKAVGVARCRGTDWIDGPGVVPEERGRGLHLPLLTAALRYVENRGARSALLIAFDEEPALIEDYRLAGFAHVETRTCWQKKLA